MLRPGRLPVDFSKQTPEFMPFRLRLAFFLTAFWGLFPLLLDAQNAIVVGRVSDAITNEGIPFANVVVQNTTTGAATDLDGNYRIEGLKPGLVNLEVSYLGYEPKVAYEIQLSNARPTTVDFALDENSSELEEIVVKAQAFEQSAESPTSLKTIGVSEIKRNPGGNRDISRAIQSLPGVSSTVSFRNDILIRGGSPSENAFFIDGIRIPTINHFATQGASGGPVGIINVDFVREVNFYSGAFPANLGQSLSSVFDFRFTEGRTDRLGGSVTVGTSDVALVAEGPLNKKKDASFIFSYRRSYLQFLFAAIGLPFLPTYDDFQFKVNYPINENHRLTVIGIGAIDQFALNLDANETPEQRYILRNLPTNNQWNYTLGAKHTWFRENSYFNFIASRSRLDNTSFKYLNNDESSLKLLDYVSTEAEHNFRVEQVSRIGGMKLTIGAGFENAIYTNDTEIVRTIDGSEPPRVYSSRLALNKFGLFGQASRDFFNERLTLSAGLTAWGNDYNREMRNPLNQLSPRLAASYVLTDKLRLNANTGIYYQLPPLTVLGYKENDEFVNRDRLSYIRCTHLIGGLEWLAGKNSRITLEGFYKNYDNYPFSLSDSVSLANLGGDFGVVGTDPFISNSEGLAYGLEFLFQQKLLKGFYGLAAYTLSWSQFDNAAGELVPSSWDSRHIVSLTGGKQFKKNWELGVRWRLSTGAPFTPFDLDRSSLVAVWDATGQGIPDFQRVNSQRSEGFNQLDLRVDKKWFFERWSLNLFLDIQNVTGNEFQGAPFVNIIEDENGLPLLDENDPTRYQLQSVSNTNGLFQPAIGIIVEL